MAHESYSATIGMCGVNCVPAACFRTGRCLGCSSDNPNQKRTSKWKCRIRRCVLERQLRHCGECTEFPCSVRRSLDRRYLDKYRINLQENIRMLSDLGPNEWSRLSKSHYTYTVCGECVDPYTLTCYACGSSH